MTATRDNIETCDSLQDIDAATGKRATVVGTYTQIDSRMRSREAPVFAGCAGVRLSDGGVVMLEPSWSPAALRDVGERDMYDGKKVEVLGIVHIEAPTPPEEVNYVLGPCISPVESVKLARD